ncbi:MAG: hypothetical protein OEY14_16330, partial [Myxococcales bacterium]|nr:hypothetical protein [Myxococcales bacterium]
RSGESSGAVVDGFTITGGKALEGGAILVTDSDPVIRHCTFRGNRAEGSFQARGGALAGMDTRLGLFDCTFETNSSTYSGGAVYFDSDLSYPSGSAPDPPLVVDCLFTGNLAKIGGALSQGSSIDGLQLAGSRFVGNLATSTGGALSLNGTVWIESCHFAGNRAEGAGGAIYTGGFFANVSLLGSTLRANASATGGGGLCATGYSTTLRSSIFWSNSADDPLAPQELWSAAFYNPGVLDVSYCTVAGGQAGVGLEVASQLEWGPGNLQVDPRFLSAIASDPHLSNSSPCIEAAEPTWVPSMFDRDIDGGPRRVGAVVDMGADETTP